MKTFMLSDNEIKLIEEHYHKFFTKAGAEDSEVVLHEMVSDGMHIDLVHYLPTDEFPYHIIATVGMSAYTMKHAPYKNIELLEILPKDWKLDENSIKEDKWYWPIEILKAAARLPYMQNSFLAVGHSFSMNANNLPFDESTEMCSGFIVPPIYFDYEFFELKIGGFLNKKSVHFLCLTTINKEELDVLMRIGSQEFYEKNLKDADGEHDFVIRNKREKFNIKTKTL